MRYILYHGNCPDGFGAAFAAWRYFGESDTKYIPAVYGEDVLGKISFNPMDEVYIVDFSFKRDILENLRSKVAKLIVLDHHKTAEEDLRGLPYCEFDMNRSGALITYDYFFKRINDGEIRNFFEYISDRDLWKWELPNSNEINSYIMSNPYTFKAYEMMLELFLDNLPKMVEAGKAIIRVNDKNVGMICDQAKLTTISIPSGDWDITPNTYKVAIVNATSHWSEVGQELLKRFPEADFSASWFLDSNGKRKYSLRSKGDFDVSQIAKYYGGGGHKNAAGFASKDEIHIW